MRRVDNFQRWLPNNINGGINNSQTCRSFRDSQCCHSENLPEFWLLSEVSVSVFLSFRIQTRTPLTCAVPTAEPWRDVTSPAQGDRLFRRDLKKKHKKKRDMRKKNTYESIWRYEISEFLRFLKFKSTFKPRTKKLNNECRDSSYGNADSVTPFLTAPNV